MKILFLIIHIVFIANACFSQETSFSAGIYFNPQQTNEFSSQLELPSKDALQIPNIFSLQFEISVWNAKKYGNIFTIKSDSFVVSLLYDKATNKDTSFFRLNINGMKAILSIPIPKTELHRGRWHTFHYSFNLAQGMVFGAVNNVLNYNGKFQPTNGELSVKIIFGDGENPAMAVRNIQIFNNKTNEPLHKWKLNEESGETANDEIGNNDGRQSGLQWIAPYHQQWKLDTVISTTQWFIHKPNYERDWETGIRWNSDAQEFYVSNYKQLDIYSLRDKRTKNVPYKSEWTGTIFFDSHRKKMYQFQPGGGKVMMFNKNTGDWFPKHPYVNPDELQFGAQPFVNPINGEILRFGGYGWFTFKNILCRYNFTTEQWDTVKISGEIPEPRDAIGFAEGKDSTEILIFGGMGSFTGSQHDGEHLFNDLYLLDLRTYTIKRIWKKETELFQRAWCTLFKISENEYVYHIQKTSPQGMKHIFYKGKLYSDTLEHLFDTVITSGWNSYYYDSYNKQFVAARFEEDSTGKTEIKIFTRAYPFLFEQKENGKLNLQNIFYVALVVTAAGVGFVMWKKRNKKYLLKERTTSNFNNHNSTKSSIQLFGALKILDSEGKEITEEFSPKILQLFLLILCTHNGEEGVSTEKLNATLWTDLSIDAAKNARGVAMNKLRALLAKVGDVTIEHTHKKWHIVFGQNFKCDFVDYSNTKNNIDEVLCILEKGIFLENIHFDATDEIKSKLHQEIISTLIAYLKKENGKLSNETALRCCNIVLMYDSLNEFAFHKKIKILSEEGRMSEAKQCYEKFVQEYKKIVEEEYEKSFKEIAHYT